MKLYSAKKKIRRFTLIELLAAMSIFSVLLLICMRIFSGAQTLWVRSEQKNNAYADVRSAMEFMSARLQTIICVDDMPFLLWSESLEKSTPAVPANNIYDKIYFATAMPMERKNSSGKDIDKIKIRFISFQLSGGDLLMQIYSDRCDNAFSYLFPPFDGNTYFASKNIALFGNEEKQIKMVSHPYYNKTIVKNCDSPAAEEDSITILQNVTSFKLMPYAMDENYNLKPYKDLTLDDFPEYKESLTEPERTNFNKYCYISQLPPFVLSIEISVMDSAENYDKWSSLSGTAKSDFEQEHSYTFRRAVILNELK